MDNASGRGSHHLLLILLAIIAVLLVSCGGGGPAAAPPASPAAETPDPDPVPEEPPPVEEPPAPTAPPILSWSPFLAPDADGNPRVLEWKYRVNGGQPLALTGPWGAATLSFDDLAIMTYDPTIGTRDTCIPFAYHGLLPVAEEPGDAVGVLQVNEFVDFTDGTPCLWNRDSASSVWSQANGHEITHTSIVGFVLETPICWAADREDLDALADGTALDPGTIGFGALNAGWQTVVDGEPTAGEPIGITLDFPQRWEVVEHLASVEVAGRTWTDVMVLDLITVIPDAASPNPELDDLPPRTARFWFAKGVGMIRMSGYLRLWQTPLDIELVSTNFSE